MNVQTSIAFLKYLFIIPLTLILHGESKIVPQATDIAAISQQTVRLNGKDLVTFPNYVRVTRWWNQTVLAH
jgi:hypothetical protein